MRVTQLLQGSCLAALVLGSLCVEPAHSYIPHRGVAPPVTGPVLANATNTFGNLTKVGYGGERLSRTNQDYGGRAKPYGTGVLVSGVCAKWSTSVTSGNSAYWNLLSHVAEGTSAVTPTPTSTGVSNQLGGAGSHTDFLVSCEDNSNNVLATSTLTYSIYGGDNSCGALNVGSTDRVDISYFPSGFGNSSDGCKVLMSTGFNKTGAFTIGMPFAHQVVLTFADPDRPGELQSIGTGSNSTHARMENIEILGSKTNGVGTAAFTLAGTDSSGDNLHRYATAAMRALGSYQCISTPDSGGGTVTHFGCEWVGGFYTIQSNWTYQYGWSRYASADAIITGGGTPHDFHIKDMTIISMKQPVSNHPDAFQINDGSTPRDYSVERVMAISAGGDVLFQGPFFGGGVSGIPTVSAPDPWMGYVDDGTTSHGAGNILTVTSAGGMQSNANNSTIYGLSGSPIGLTDGVTASCGTTPCPFGAKFTGTGSGTNLTVSGIPASPNAMVIRVGYTLRGNGVPDGTKIVSQSSGTSGKNGVYVTSNATTSSGDNLVAGPQYTLTGFSGNYGSYASPVQFYGVENINATWDMIWNSGDVIQGTFYSGSSGTSSLSHFTHMREITTGVTGIGSPRLRFQNCSHPIYNGTLTVAKGAEYSAWDSDCSPSTDPPPNTTVASSVFNAGQDATTLASWYVNGNPKDCLEAKSTADWDALSVQQAMVYAASCTIVKTSGPLDLGSGDIANAIGTALTPEWADGTVIGTGFDGQ